MNAGASDKRLRERAILNVIYDEAHFAFVDQQESPDFRLQRSDAPPFGVEITELFDTESDARIATHPTYVSDLLAGKNPMHRDDAKNLEVSEVTIYDPEGKEKASGVPGIIRLQPTVGGRADRLAEVITKKEKKASSYAPGLSHVNLAIMDRSDRSWKPESLNVGELLTLTLRDKLFHSSFREVFFITRTRARQRFYVPMRMLLLVSELYIMEEAISSFDAVAVEQDDLVPLFVGFMDRLGFPVNLVSVPGRGLGAHLGNTVVQVNPSGDVAILDLADHEMPEVVANNGEAMELVDNPAFIEHHEHVLEQATFVTEIAMDPVVDPPF